MDNNNPLFFTFVFVIDTFSWKHKKRRHLYAMIDHNVAGSHIVVLFVLSFSLSNLQLPCRFQTCELQNDDVALMTTTRTKTLFIESLMDHIILHCIIKVYLVYFIGNFKKIATVYKMSLKNSYSFKKFKS